MICLGIFVIGWLGQEEVFKKSGKALNHKKV